MIPYTIIKEVNPDDVKGSATGATNCITFGISAIIGPLFWQSHKFAPALQGKPLVLDIGGIVLAFLLAIPLRETGKAHRVHLGALCRSPLRKDSPSSVGASSTGTTSFMSVLGFVLVCLSVLMEHRRNKQPLSIRGDFAGQRSYAASLGSPPRRNQLTVAFDVIIKFDVFR
jgi:hypothetical protein